MSTNQVRSQVTDQLRWNVAFDPWILIAFLFPFLRLLVVDIGGKIFAQDLGAVVILLVMARQSDTPLRLKRISGFLLLLVLWLLGLILTDIYRNTAYEDFQRGWAKIILFGLQAAALWLFLPRRVAYFLSYTVGSAIVGVVSASQLEPPFDEQPWKFGLGDSLSLMVAAVFCGIIPGTEKLRKFAGPALLMAGVYLLLKGARAGFGIMVIAGGYCLAVEFIQRNPLLRQNISKQMFATLLAGGLIVSQAATGFYGYLAESGRMGIDAQYKYRAQAGGDVSVLQGGRAESLVSTVAIADSPILGHGSWARDLYYVRLLRSRMRELGIAQDVEIAKQGDQIPSHSYFFGAWVEGGIAGGIFWAYVASMAFIATFWLLRQPQFLMPLAIYSILSLIWGIAFSPFGAEMRFVAAFQIVITMWILRFGDRASPTPVRPIA
jgi:hypothetical protein